MNKERIKQDVRFWLMVAAVSLAFMVPAGQVTSSYAEDALLTVSQKLCE